MERYYLIETKVGRAWAKPTSGTHIYLAAGSNVLPGGTPEYPKGSRMGPVTVNGVVYAASAHFTLIDGRWTCEPPHERDGVYMSRLEYLGLNREWTWPARRKLMAIWTAAINTWAESPEGVQAIAEAVKQDAEQKEETRQSEIANLKTRLAELEQVNS